MAGATHPAFATLLRRYRRAATLTQEELAARAGYSTVYIGMLERGERRPGPATVDLLAAALALTPHDRALLDAAARQHRGYAASAAPLAGPSVPPLVGRAHEVGVLERHLVGEGPPVLLLAGEPGIGKTRLLYEAAALGATCGWQVLQGGCQRRGGQEPYAPLLAALERHMSQREPGRLRAELEGCEWLTRMLPELIALGLEPPAWTLSPAQERRLIAGAVIRFLARAAGPTGALLVLDDLHWANPDALALLVTLVCTGPERPLRVVGAYRDTEVPLGNAFAETLADLAQAGLATRLPLGPLAVGEAAQLLDRLTGGAAPELRARLVQRAEGVPFFLISCAQALRAGALGGTGGAGIPWDMAQGVRQRVAALPPPARALLDVAAVVGRQAARPLLLAALGWAGEEAPAALEAACQARLLEEGIDGYRFAHDVIREVVESDLSVTRRQALHCRVAEALERATGEPGAGEPAAELLAYHYARAGVEERAAAYLEQAGDRARERAAHAAAEEYYRAAVEQLDGLGRAGDGDASARVREKLGAVLTAAARYEEALDVLQQAVAAYRAAGDLPGLVRAATGIGQAHNGRGTSEEGIRYLEALVPLLEAGGAEHELALLYAILAGLYPKCGRYDEQLAAAERAATLARSAGDQEILAAVEERRGTALLVRGRVREAIVVLEEAIPVIAAVGSLDGLYRALTNASTAYLYTGEFERGRPHVERALEVAEQSGDQARIVRARSNRGEQAYYTGDWRQARVDFAAAAALSRTIGASSAAAYPLLDLGLLLLAEGAWDEAARYLEECVALATESGDLQALRWAHSLLAERDLLAGHPDRARQRILPLLDRPGLEELDVTVLLPLLAWAYLEMDELEQASTVAVQAIARTRAKSDHLNLVEALRVGAMVLARQKRWADAAALLQEGLTRTRAMPYPYAEARLLYADGLLHLEQGQPCPARERLEAALAIFRQLGARHWNAQTEAAIARSHNSWMGRADIQVSDAQWSRIQALLPPPRRHGRRRADDRRTLEAILYVQRTGHAWANLPPEFGDDATAHRRLEQWQSSGLWTHIVAILRGA